MWRTSHSGYIKISVEKVKEKSRLTVGLRKMLGLVNIHQGKWKLKDLSTLASFCKINICLKVKLNTGTCSLVTTAQENPSAPICRINTAI